MSDFIEAKDIWDSHPGFEAMPGDDKKFALMAAFEIAARFASEKIEPLVAELAQVKRALEMGYVVKNDELAALKTALQARDKDYHEAYGHYSDATIEFAALKTKIEATRKALEEIAAGDPCGDYTAAQALAVLMDSIPSPAPSGK